MKSSSYLVRSAWTLRSCRWLDVAGVAGVLTYAVLARESHAPAPPRLIVILGALAAGWLVLGLGRVAVGRGSSNDTRRAIVSRVLIWGVLFRVAGLTAEPLLEDDWSRYLWDGYRFAETGTPYGVPPMAHFPGDDLPPGFASVLDGINNPDLPTIYGPVNQLAFLVSYVIAPGELIPLRMLLMFAELAAALLLLRWFPTPAQALLWFWCPLLIHESAFNAHPEALGILLLIGALLAHAEGRMRAVPVLAALAVGARPFALLVVPFLLWRRGVRAWCTFGALLAGVYLPFVVQGNFGATSLGAMAHDWEFNSSGYAIVSMAFQRSDARLISAMLFGALYLGVFASHVRNGDRHPPPGGRVFGLLFLFSPVVNPWYLLWLLPFAVVRPSCWAWAALASVSLSYVHGMGLGEPMLASYEHPWWLRPVEFGVIGVALGIDALRGLAASQPRRHASVSTSA